jgi:hypothetical protein
MSTPKVEKTVEIVEHYSSEELVSIWVQGKEWFSPESLTEQREAGAKEARERIAALCYKNLSPDEMYYEIFNPSKI